MSTVTPVRRLRCCRPTRYDGRSRTLVHGYACVIGRSGHELTDAEYAELAHPVAQRKPSLRLVRREALEPHPSCADGTPCSTCAPLIHPAGCVCEPCGYSDAHADDEDDEREVVS